MVFKSNKCGNVAISTKKLQYFQACCDRIRFPSFHQFSTCFASMYEYLPTRMWVGRANRTNFAFYAVLPTHLTENVFRRITTNQIHILENAETVLKGRREVCVHGVNAYLTLFLKNSRRKISIPCENRFKLFFAL